MKKTAAPPISPLSDAQFRNLFESLAGLYLILDPAFTIVAVSDTYLVATMTRREEIVGRGIFDVFPDNPNDPKADGTRNLTASLQRVLKYATADAMPIQKYDIRQPTGEFEERYWKPVNSPILGANGKVIYIIHCVEDVTKIVLLDRQSQQQIMENEALRTQSKQIESNAYAQVQASENRLKNLVNTILDTIVDGVITINEQGNIKSYNKACARLFGYTPEEVLEKNINILMPEPYRREHDGYLHNYRKSRIPKIIGIGREVSGQRKDGTTFPMELAVGETTQGGDHAFVGIIRDVTERHEAEKAREQLRQAQKMEALGQLTGGIAHDFNNLLAIVLGNLDFMTEKTKEDDPLRAFINPSIEAAEHGAELTKQLLAFGRKQTLQPKIISINELLNYFILLVRHTLGERIEIILSPSEGLWNVNVDPTLLQNALLNLAVNARDAMPAGGKMIFETKNVTIDREYLSHTPEILSGDYVMIAVSDTGEGMSQEIMDKAFDPFFTTKAIGKGSGLGLSMVYGFVKQSAGHIKLYSEIGHGTAVKIYLPKAEGEAQIPANKSTGEAGPVEKNASIVLVVEDNKNVLKLTSGMVESLGYKVITATSGDAAIEILERREDIDLLLTDVMLPGMLNGPELAKLAVKLHPNLKVIFNSGYAEHAIHESGILENGVHLISKPFRKQQLAAIIKEVLKLP